jgi:ribosomal protein S18 acetylase RimI-like enzyme
VEVTIRPVQQDDHETLIALAERAWKPVFASVNDVLGAELAELLHGPDWRQHHADEIRDILNAEATTTWVAEVDGALLGFAAARVVDTKRRIGEVLIVGVHPSAQRRGVATALVREAEVTLANQGVAVAYIATGGDPGHAAARRLYDSLSYRPVPSIQYFKVLRRD